MVGFTKLHKAVDFDFGVIRANFRFSLITLTFCSLTFPSSRGSLHVTYARGLFPLGCAAHPMRQPMYLREDPDQTTRTARPIGSFKQEARHQDRARGASGDESPAKPYSGSIGGCAYTPKATTRMHAPPDAGPSSPLPVPPIHLPASAPRQHHSDAWREYSRVSSRPFLRRPYFRKTRAGRATLTHR
ncbi:hypothetical protein LshimejAT787_0101400 [Lyophyllum shimeji]|uniref:Uncharacterized protein n=1 Tax=Lyophyllum shimeji TaxID=47721 RepID=A0A9P3PD51_LYOSH|nr:hypothetical protein LshimejAT787_0101400 [Lyophyllum shimeji]